MIKADTVYIVEGEKDADNLSKLGLVATTCPMGAGKWRNEYNQYLKGKNIVIIPDNDGVGKKHSLDIAKSLYGIARNIKILELPGLPEKGDVSDWLNQGHTKDELLSLVEKTSEFNPDTYKEFSILNCLPTGKELQKCDVKVGWLIENLLPERSLTLLTGRGGIGKTWLALQIAKAVSEGIPFMGLPVQKRCVVYLDYENPLPVLVERVRVLKIEKVFFWHQSAIPLPRIDNPVTDNGKTFEDLKTFPKGTLFIVDTLRSIQSGDENSSQDMSLVMNKLKELRDAGFTILLLHHTPKNNEKIYKGSTAIFDLSDHILSLYPVRKQEDIENTDDCGFEFDCYYFGTKDKTRFKPFNIWLTSNKESGGFSAVHAHGLTKKGRGINILEVLKEILYESGGRLTYTELWNIANTRHGLKSRGKFDALIKRGKGQYWNTTKEGRNTYICLL